MFFPSFPDLLTKNLESLFDRRESRDKGLFDEIVNNNSITYITLGTISIPTLRQLRAQVWVTKCKKIDLLRSPAMII